LKIRRMHMAIMNFGGVDEKVITRDEFPLSKAQEVLKNDTIAVLGYGVQGPGQSLNRMGGCRERPCFHWKKRQLAGP
jgi:hypothetical protein